MREYVLFWHTDTSQSIQIVQEPSVACLAASLSACCLPAYKCICMLSHLLTGMHAGFKSTFSLQHPWVCSNSGLCVPPPNVSQTLHECQYTLGSIQSPSSMLCDTVHQPDIHQQNTLHIDWVQKMLHSKKIQCSLNFLFSTIMQDSSLHVSKCYLSSQTMITKDIRQTAE